MASTAAWSCKIVWSCVIIYLGIILVIRFCFVRVGLCVVFWVWWWWSVRLVMSVCKEFRRKK